MCPGCAALEARVSALEARLGEKAPHVDPDMLYSAAEVSARLRCSLSNVYDLMESRAIAVTRTGSRTKGLKVRGSDILAFLDSRREGGPKPLGKFKHLNGYLD